MYSLESKEGATSSAADLTDKLSIGEKKDVLNIFCFSTAAESQVQNSEDSKEGATSLAAIVEKIDVSIFRFSTAAESQVQNSEECKEGATSLANVFQFSTAEKMGESINS
ncbi:hypothetical protein MKW98_007463 [Papaver atlanticum]|uniref:Uncharacterized protein n=1 Tax=Papaver atlanticum TaxID=357466 RepID=A0AAD4XBL9_9MAGN|nr:hypothetical protein MKW98_007463 [Papaver atlanticum]